MYKKAYGIIETLAPLHVGATAGEESGNLNLIFRDQFTQTGIVPGSSIRGRFRSEIRQERGEETANLWYGAEAEPGQPDSTSESFVKFEYASIVWLPVFCPGQPIVWVSSPRLLKRYQRITGISDKLPKPYTASQTLKSLNVEGDNMLFFNFGFLTVEKTENLTSWFPLGEQLPAIVVGDDEISMIHDMALYRQSRVALDKQEKKVRKGAFFNTEALPEGSFLIFAIALRNDPNGNTWQPFSEGNNAEVYLGGLESIGFGHCHIIIQGI
ncbi:RAMP superfamily CRISPR-associated protein [Limnoraphis robusta Tam1]|uniref:RAMP superfamily CRISPR-associated protein n=1 Tax=Limnoraphis robusta TaxID=1118279 RepID=UPI002B2089D1|nr:RAMP superfamily CRISPR-associated protein [Limnoraphis robusta]MEA5542565.1 RAMP superfamily CRISPR-associated protein [Limnoraphis robusta Tam1]